MIAVVGGGPAGLRAAEVAAQAGEEVVLFEAKAGLGRKFLVAGKGGLNLTHDEPLASFASRYDSPAAPPGWWGRSLAECSPADLRRWAAALGCETFVATSGRVYPRALKAAALLRSWQERLRELGVQFRLGHRWLGLRAGKDVKLTFAVEGETKEFSAHAAILALGGASWPETGSDGAWVSSLTEVGVGIRPFEAANCGWEVAWTPGFLKRAEGAPLKNLEVRTPHETVSGELLITRYGLEGGVIYRLGRCLRTMAAPSLEIDFKPGSSIDQLVDKLAGATGELWAAARQRWRLTDAAAAVIEHALSDRLPVSASDLAHCVKHTRLALLGSRPLAEAISSAGGVRWDELDEDLMLRQCAGVFVAGEMIDWEAPTGGYLLQGAFATGARAGRAAGQWAKIQKARQGL